MTDFAHDSVVPYKESELTKKQQVAGMFDDISGRYDFLNRFLSAGIDIGWRKKAIAQLADLKPRVILDVATGTADVAIMTYNMLKPEKITGIDISDGMLDVGRGKIIKLGLNEYIELSKYYSTPKSATFVNGLLDQLIPKLQAAGKVHKIGRGLVE